MVKHEGVEDKSTMDRIELVKEGAEIVARSPQLFIDVDIEADGIAGYGSMLSIGAVSPTGDSFYTELKPDSEDFNASQREFCENHGLERERLLREAPDVSDAMGQFMDWITSQTEKTDRKPVLTAFNAAFDWSFVDLYFAKAGVKNPFGIAPFDLKSLAMAVSNDWDWKDTSKDALPAIVIPDREFTHNALEDARYQQEIHFALAALINRQSA